MALFNGVISSEVLGLDTNIIVILPHDRPTENQAEPCKVLYLLHGLSDSAHGWTRYTAIERYAREYGYAVIMPEVSRSFYLDMKYGLKYFTYVSEELPALCQKIFRLSGRREDTFIAGLSMGGYGAMKCALTFPERYAAAASFSGALDLEDVVARAEQDNLSDEFRGALGVELEILPEDNLKILADEFTAVPSVDRPELFITCGKQDYIYEHSKSFSDYLNQLLIDHRYHEWDGAHEWKFWDKSIEMAIKFFEGEEYTV